MFNWFRKNTAAVTETRASGSGFTAELIAARESYLSGARGIGELTATVQSCVSLWEAGLSAADVTGTDLLSRRQLAMAGRSLALRGEALFIFTGRGLVPAHDWDVSTRHGEPRAYRLSIAEAGGGYTRTALAAEVLHIRLGTDPAAPWIGTAPLRRASLTAGLLDALERALGEVYEHAPIGSQIVPFPESGEADLDKLGRGFRGRRGRVLLRESVHVQAAGGPAPSQDWRPQDVTPDLQRAMTSETLDRARASIMAAFGVLPAMFDKAAQGPLVREAQRHLAQWQLQPIAQLIAEEAGEKLGAAVTLDVMRPLQAFDAGGRARALNATLQAIATAKAGGLDASEIDAAARLVDWELQ